MVPRLFVREFRFEGNTVFPSEELGRITAPFTGREVTAEELEQARRAVTLHYVDRGYVNSGAILPDQDPSGGVVTLRIVEGVLSGVELHGNDWLRDGFVLGRLRRWSGPPLNLVELQEGLQVLRQDPNVSQVNAELKPGNVPGESLLDLRVKDRQPFRLGLQFDNQRPPSVGSEQLWILASDLNVTGNSDPLEIRYGLVHNGGNGPEFSGVGNFEASYAIPVTRFDTTLQFRGSRLNTSLVEEPFASLLVDSVTSGYGLTVRQPLVRSASQEFAVSVGFDRRENFTELLGQPFNISPGAVGGEMVASVLRVSQEWLRRGPDQVIALRSTFNFGLDAFGSTDNGIAGDPNGRFFSWLGQAQYIRRLFGTQSQLVLRASGQWSGEPLLALEQMSVGGFDSVRGYLENQLVRDRGVVGSVEFRIPIAFNKAGAGALFLAPFFDVGGAWDKGGSPGADTLAGTGVGLLFTPSPKVSAQLYWGHRLRSVPMPIEENLQTEGVTFRLTVMAF